jgi:hypothetical protein
MKLLFLVSQIFLSGCSNSEAEKGDRTQQTPSGPSLATNQREEGIRQLFEKLLMDHIGTCGTFPSDFTESVRLADSTHESLKMTMNADQLRRIVENTFRLTRTYWKSLPEHTLHYSINGLTHFPITTELIRTFLIFRFLRNAKVTYIMQNGSGNVDLPEGSLGVASSQYVSMAKSLSDSHSFDAMIESFRTKIGTDVVTSDTHWHYLQICTHFNLIENCPSLILRAILGIHAAIFFFSTTGKNQINQPWVPLQPVLQYLNGSGRISCQQNDAGLQMLRRKTSASLFALGSILDEPSEQVLLQPDPLLGHLKMFYSKLNNLDQLHEPNC